MHISKKRVSEIVFFVLQSIKIPSAVISVHFIGDKKMRHLNAEYRGKDYATDVLSFAYADTAEWPSNSGNKNGKSADAGTDQIDLGDMFICVPQIVRQAKECEVSVMEEMVEMLIHGTLHLAGYDHIAPKEEQIMLPLQKKLLKKVLARGKIKQNKNE